jgi:hypothetical protein
MMSSEAGQTEHQDLRSQQSGSEKMVPYKLLNFEKLDVKEILGNESSGDYQSLNSNSPHVQSLNNSVYAFFGDSPESKERKNIPLVFQQVHLNGSGVHDGSPLNLSEESSIPFVKHQKSIHNKIGALAIQQFETTDAEMEDLSDEIVNVEMH